MRDRLIHLALAVLDEALQEAAKRPVRSSVSLRLALAYLFSQSDQTDRKTYDDFWLIVTGRREHQGHQPLDYIRAVSATTFVHRICHSFGIDYNVEFEQKLRDGSKDKTATEQ